MRKTLITSALLLALSCPVLAGEMHTPGSPTPPPPAPIIGEIPNPPAPQPEGVMDEGVTLNGIVHTPGLSKSLAQLGLDLLAILPSIL